jgi:hypothetical protein
MGLLERAQENAAKAKGAMHGRWMRQVRVLELKADKMLAEQDEKS